jgi:sugar O-acyltransferase (sialic acid O-acetyltransferase NeuD family)
VTVPRSSPRVILVGALTQVVELCEDCGTDIVGIIHPTLQGDFMGHPILGDDAASEVVCLEHPGVPVVVLAEDPETRRKLVRRFAAAGFGFGALVHPDASISRHARIGRAAIIRHRVNVAANAVIGDFVILNTFANVMHDVRLGDYCTVAPNAVLLGRVAVGDGTYVGANATILPNRVIGGRAVVGAGAVVTRDVAEGSTVAGNPARELRTA